MAMSRKLQYQTAGRDTDSIGKLPFIGVDESGYTKAARVVFQGAEGAYSQAAMMQYFGDKRQQLPCGYLQGGYGSD